MSRWRQQVLAIAAVAAIMGIIIAEHGEWRTATWAGLALWLLAAWPLVKTRTRRSFWACALLVCLFGLRHQWRLDQTYEHPLLQHLETSGEAAWGTRAEVVARVQRSTSKPGENTRMELRAKTVRLSDEGLAFDQPCRLRAIASPALAAQASDLCVLTGVLRPLRAAMNEGEFSARDFALRSGAVAEMEVLGVTPLPSPAWLALPRRARDAAERCRSWIKERLASGLAERPQEMAVIQAMALGASEDTDPRVEEPFRRSGTLHVFAVSGLHVGLIGIILHQALRPLRLRRPALVAALIALVFAYAFVTGWRPSAARAALMITVVLLGTLAQRRGALLNTLGAAALLLLAWDSHALFLPGFQLSFGVLLAIALLAKKFGKPLLGWAALDPFLPPSLAPRRQRVRVWLKRKGAGLAATSGSAWLGSLPLMWWHFHTVTPAGLLANCVLVPAAFFCLSLSFAGMLAGLLPFCGLWLQTAANQANGHLAALMLASAGGFAGLPLAHVHVPPPSKWFGQSETELRVLALPYGGEAALLRLQNRFWLLDCGHTQDFGRVLLPTLRRAGVNRLEGLFLSHADAAHIGSVEALLQALPVKVIYHPLHEPWPADSGATRMRSLLERQRHDFPHTRFQALGAEQSLRLDDSAQLTVLYPASHDRQPRADDRGLVTRVELNGLRLLWVADAGLVTENRLLERPSPLRCDVLLRGAHASDFHGTDAFLRAAAPRLILNAGLEHPPGGQATPAVRRYAARTGQPPLFLSEHGEVTLRRAGGTDAPWRVETFKTRLHLTLPP